MIKIFQDKNNFPTTFATRMLCAPPVGGMGRARSLAPKVFVEKI